MDLGLSEVPAIIASSTTGYLIQFSPIFVLIGGLVLAVGVVGILISFFFPSKEIIIEDFDYEKADSLEEFYSRKGRTRGDYDYDTLDSDYKPGR